MKAIIIPGVTDLNKGDQALVWESFRLVKDTNCFDEIVIMESGDSEYERILLCSQSKKQGFPLIENILPHPRRGKHYNNEYVTESKLQFFLQVKNALFDFLKTSLILLIAPNLNILRCLFPNKIYKTVKQFHDSEVIFVKGGGFIHAYGEKSAPYLMWYFLFYVRLAHRLNKKTVFLPNSYGPFNGFTVKKQVRNVFSKIDLVYSRERISSVELSKLLNKGIPLEYDLGFFLKKGDNNIAIEILKKYNLYGNYKVIGLTIRPWRFPGCDNRDILYANYIHSIAELVKHLIDKGFKIAICNQSLGPNAHEDDRNAINDLLKIINHPNLIWINENLTCDILKAVYSNFYFFVGTRFHSIIFSLTSLVPSIAIGYGGNKAKGIMSDFNLEEFVININDINPSLLIGKFDEAIKQYDKIKQKLITASEHVNESRERILVDIKQLVK